MGRWQQPRVTAAVEDSVGSDEWLMEEKATESRECSDRGGRRGSVKQPVGSGYNGSRRALLRGEGAVGRRSYPVMIKQRGGARRLCCSCSRRCEVAMSGEGRRLRMSCGWRRSSRSDGRWPPQRLLAESVATTLTAPRDERGRAGDRQIKERDHETIVSKGLSMGFLSLKEFWVSWFVDLGRGLKDDGSECYSWLRWEATAIGWRWLRGWSPGSLDLKGLP
ncbi:hypothetical protein BHM03_00054394 [Ensete ventricosum]|nr:hypothetical protein BHM03_00054394 [Ensete ventricosum]